MQQWLRKCSLLVSGAKDSFDVSELRIVFEIKKTQNETPNAATIKIYNLAKETQSQIISEGQRVVLQAGYLEGFGIIFDGEIIQMKKGRESGTDTYVEIIASDGDSAYNFAVINTTIAAGSTQNDHINAVQSSMGVPLSQVDADTTRLPRGKVMFGAARDVLRQSAQSNKQNWSIQDGKLQIVSSTGLLKNQAIMLNSKSGLIGEAEQSNEGIKAKALLNPMLRIGAKVIINEDDVSFAKKQTDTTKKRTTGELDNPSSDEKLAIIAKDGAYKIIGIDYKGDTRGNDWFAEIVCIDIDALDKSKKKGKK